MVISELLRQAVKALSEGGAENARFEAECIMKKFAGADRITLLTEPNREASEKQESAVREMLSRRLNGEPLQYILGEWELYGFPFEVGEGVLIPRQDTETIIELAEKHLKPDMLCADLCAGSGCIGISLARLCGCRVCSYELSERAFPYLQRNISKNGVSGLVVPILGDVLSEETAERSPLLDAIVSNPPYLTAREMEELQKEVTFEPKMALYGGEDGLDYCRAILKIWTKRLKSGGLFAVEIGCGQESGAIRIFERNGIPAEAVKDYCGIYRVVYGIKP